MIINKNRDSTFKLILTSIFLGLTSFLIQILISGLLLSLNISFFKDNFVIYSFSTFGTFIYTITLIYFLSDGKIEKYGFDIPSEFFPIRMFLIGFLLGSFSTLLQFFLSLESHPITKQVSFLQLIIIAWIYASILEEIICRGLVQSYLAPLKNKVVSIFNIRLSLPVIVSAVFFGFMHISLFSGGTTFFSILYIVAFAFFVGLFTGFYREKTGSIIPAIILHASANMGGSLMGLLIKNLF